MMRLAALITPARLLAAQQAVVLDVVGLGQLKGTPEGNQQHHRQNLDAQPGDQQRIQRRTDQRRLQHLVVETPHRLAATLKALRFQIPGAEEGAGHLTKDKAIDTLAHARGGWVFGSSHIAVVTAVVFDKEVAITPQRQRDLGQPALQRGLLVTHLMPQIQPKAQAAAGCQNHRQRAVPRQFMHP